MENTEIKQKNPLNKQALIGLGAFALCVVMLIVGFINVKNTSFFKIPVVDKLLPDFEYETDEMEELFEEGVDEVKEYIDESDLSKDEKEYLNDFVSAVEKAGKKFSVNSISNLADVVEEAMDKLDDDAIDVIGDVVDGVDELQKAIKTIEKIILWFVLIPMAFTVLGGLLRSKSWTIVALVTSLPFFFLLGGAVWGIIAIVGYIAQIVIYGKLKKAKKAAAAV
jgi:hypothetical protein